MKDFISRLNEKRSMDLTALYKITKSEYII